MCYKHITINKRYCILERLNLGSNISKIAKELNRSKATISREIKRNTANFLKTLIVDRGREFAGYEELE